MNNYFTGRAHSDPARANVNALARGKLGANDLLPLQDLTDRIHVNPAEPIETAYWCKKWGCTDVELRGAVKHVGVAAGDVEHWLRTIGHKRK